MKKKKIDNIIYSIKDNVLIEESTNYTNVVLVETVGVGQSETQVVDLTNLVVLLVNPASGDQLQGIKKGIELSDKIVVNKADGKLQDSARRTMLEYREPLHLLSFHEYQRFSEIEKNESNTVKFWTKKVLQCSGLTGNGIEEIWKEMQDFKNLKQNSFVKDKIYPLSKTHVGQLDTNSTQKISEFDLKRKEQR